MKSWCWRFCWRGFAQSLLRFARDAVAQTNSASSRFKLLGLNSRTVTVEVQNTWFNCATVQPGSLKNGHPWSASIGYHVISNFHHPCSWHTEVESLHSCLITLFFVKFKIALFLYCCRLVVEIFCKIITISCKNEPDKSIPSLLKRTWKPTNIRSIGCWTNQNRYDARNQFHKTWVL